MQKDTRVTKTKMLERERVCANWTSTFNKTHSRLLLCRWLSEWVETNEVHSSIPFSVILIKGTFDIFPAIKVDIVTWNSRTIWPLSCETWAFDSMFKAKTLSLPLPGRKYVRKLQRSNSSFRIDFVYSSAYLSYLNHSIESDWFAW